MTASIRRRPGRVAPAVLAFALGLLGLLILPPTPAAAEERSAIEVFGGCLSAQKKGDLVLLIDESASLRDTDPDGARVTAAGYLLNQLAGFAAEGKVALDVTVAGFASDYAEAVGWTRLGGDGARTLDQTLDSFRDRTDGYETDYWNGLNGARQQLAERSKADPDRCQAIVWFTDGTLDLDLRRNAEDRERYGEHKAYAPDLDLDTEDRVRQAETAARRDLCRAGGLADQLRGNRVTLFAIGLRGSDAKASDFDTMRAIATGASGDEKCGKITKPTPGEFTLASNIDDLLFALDRMRDPSREPTETEAGVCQGKVCQQRHNIVLDNSLSSVHILGSANVNGLTVVLVRPDGKTITLKRLDPGRSAEAESGGVAIGYAWQSARTVSIDLKRSGNADWTGQWAVVFVDPKANSPKARSRTNIHVSGDVFPAWPDAKKTTLRAGEQVKGVTFGLADAAGKAINPRSLLGSAKFGATLTVPGGQELVLADGVGAKDIAAARTLDLTDVRPGRATLRLSVAVTTAATTDAQGKRVAGTPLAPRVIDIPVAIGPPLGFPTPASSINFGSAEGPADLTAALPVNGPGCIWLDAGSKPEINSGPDTIGETKISSSADSADSCVRIAEGQQAELALRLTTAEAGNGSLNGTMAIMVAPAEAPDRATKVMIDFTADLSRPLNPVNFVAVLLAALILGPGIPIALLYLGKWLTATIPSRALLARRIPIMITAGPPGGAGRVLRLERGQPEPLTLTERDFTDMVRLSNSGSRTAAAEGATLRTSIGRSPFGAGFVLVDSPGLVGASSTDPDPYGPERQARLPLAVHNTWVVQHDPAGPADQAQLLIFIGADLTADRLRTLAEDIDRRAPDLVQRLHASGPAQDAPDWSAAHPFDDPDGGAATVAPSPFQDQQPPPGPTAMPPVPGPGQDKPARPAGHDQPARPAGQDQPPPRPAAGTEPGAESGDRQDTDWSFDFDDLDEGPGRRP
ncbi:vWA domain-containing protein [Microlunatus speluncae]|uniref:vWA domain-containing protein n=1 Tax=Microlunatus speluncae TaxID=2594267 RepID=UPI00126619C9|nr:VWA domain-containing protein [Microlunatus speluncae]